MASSSTSLRFAGILALQLLGAMLLLAGPAWGHHPADPVAAAPLPPERPDRGLVYKGLEPAEPSGRCAGLLELREGPEDVCTPGPDLPPRGVDVGDRRGTAELAAAKSEEPDPTEPVLETPGQASIPCVGTGSDGNRVVAIYARAANVVNRYAAIAPLITQWAAQASGVYDSSAVKTGGSRQIRFQTSAPPLCALTVENVTLTSAGDDSFANTVNELRAKGYTRTDRKYLVWMDANVICGQAQVYGDASPAQTNYNNGRSGVAGMIGRVDNGCWGRLGQGQSVEAHELGHAFGGVQLSAPNSSGGWHCTDEADTMCYSDAPYYPAMRAACPSVQEKLLDCNGDDYFNTRPATNSYLATHWNVANSSFLTTAQSTPDNDAFVAAAALSGPSASRYADHNSGAGKEASEPQHAGNPGGASTWYSWTAPSAEPVTITTAGSNFDTLLAAYTGNSVGTLAPVAAGDDLSATDRTSRISFTPVAGTTYRIAVDGHNGGTGAASGLVALTLSQQASTPAEPQRRAKKKKCKRKRLKPGKPAKPGKLCKKKKRR